MMELIDRYSQQPILNPQDVQQAPLDTSLSSTTDQDTEAVFLWLSDSLAALGTMSGQPLDSESGERSEVLAPVQMDSDAEEPPDAVLQWLSDALAALGTTPGYPLDSNSGERYDVLAPVQMNFGEVPQTTEGDQDMMDVQNTPQEEADDYIYISELDLAGHQSLGPELEFMQPY